ncbi:MAG: MFS transporter, partial [Parvibaculaceae bacterium]|nr:MFS transporter [Parvibaculaceae bacterium]
MNQQAGMPNYLKTHWPNFYYGWVIVAVCAVIMTVTAGFGFYNLSVYLKAFVNEQGFSVSLTSGATASFFVASGITGMLVGSVIDRFDIRWSIAFGALFCAVTLSLIGWVHTIFQLYLFHILFGIGYTFAALIPCTTLVARWFNKNRSSALAIASTGLSLGGILLTPVSVKLISDFGLGGAGPWLGLLFVLAIVPLAVILLRPSPQSIGLLPDGAALPESGVAPQLDGVPLNIVLRSRFFILSTIAYVFAMMAQVGAISHQFNLASTRTGDDELAAFTIAILGGASIVGRLSGGVLLTYIDSKKFILFLFLLQGLSLYLYSEVE